jgi:hypothetical protein
MWWTGAGVLGLVFPGAAGAGGYFLAGPVGTTCGILIGSVLTWVVGRRLNDDPADLDRHTLYWIPLEYWAFISGLYGVVRLIAQAIQSVRSFFE